MQLAFVTFLSFFLSFVSIVHLYIHLQLTACKIMAFCAIFSFLPILSNATTTTKITEKYYVILMNNHNQHNTCTDCWKTFAVIRWGDR